MVRARIGLTIAAGLSFVACGDKEPERAAPTDPPPAAETVDQRPQAPQPTAAPPPPPPAVVFWQRLQALCGNAYAGGLTVGTEESDREIGYAALTMHVRYCDDSVIRIPFHVDDNSSRTWVLSRDGQTLSLRHVHRHEDGTKDAVTNYGGTHAAPGSADRQEFPVDEETVAMLPAAEGNVWAIEIEPDRRFAYELQRERDMRYFRVEFDLRETVAEPPPPWGSE